MDPKPSLDLWADAQQLLQFHFMRNAFAAGTIVAVLAGLVGYFMVVRGQSFAGHTLSQVGFPGAAGAALVGAPPLLGLLTFCIGGAIAIAALSNQIAGDRRTETARTETAAIGTVLAFALALGFLFASLYRGFIDTMYGYLFGTFVGISDSQVLTLLLVAGVAVVTLIVIGRPLLFASIDADVAAARGVPVRLLSVVFLVLLGLAVAAAALITGTLLVFALLVAPAAAAQQLSPRPVLGLVASVAIAVAVTWLGLGIAYFTVYPIGFFVTTIAFVGFLLARAYRWLSGRADRGRGRRGRADRGQDGGQGQGRLPVGEP